MGEYLRGSEQRRSERPDGKFADVDITEFMRRAENLDRVAEIDMKFISSELLSKRPELFRHEAQKARLRTFIQNHKLGTLAPRPTNSSNRSCPFRRSRTFAMPRLGT